MQTNSDSYRLSGLLAVLGLLALLLGLIVMLLLPDIRYWAWILLMLGIVLLATAFIMDFRQVGRALTSRRGIFSAGATVMASTFIGIILLVNAISIGNYQRFDLTGLSQFTLTPQTQEILGKLEAQVQVLAFSIPGEPYGEYAINLLEEYKNYTEQLSIKSIDPAEDPEMARQYGTTQIPVEYRYPTVVFESESGRRLVFSPQIQVQAEYSFTSAILEVTGIAQKKILFLTGHGETDLYTDYSQVREGLLENLFKVGVLDLTATPNIPEDTAALIIAGSQTSLSSAEIDIIERYLENNGRALILINPDPPEEIKQLVSAWGVEIKDGTIIDPSSHVAPNKNSPLVTWQGSEIYFPGATAIIPQAEYTPKLMKDEQGNVTPQPIWTSENSSIQISMPILFWTSKESWLENDFDPREEPEFNEGVEPEGPLFIGAIIETVPPEGESPEQAESTQLIIIGDSDFAANRHYFNGENGKLFLDLVGAITAGTEIVEIERKVLPFRRLVVDQEAVNLIRISSIVLLPLLVLIIGGIIWWRRR